MKKAILSAIVTLIALYSYSQPSLSFKLGYHLSRPDIKTATSFYKPASRSSYHVFALLNFKVQELFNIQSGLGLVDKSFVLSDYPFSPPGAPTSQIRYEISPLYLELPLNVVKKFEVGRGNISVGAGPYAAIGVSGTMITGTYYTYNGYTFNPSRSIAYGNSADDDVKKMDFGFNFNAAYEFNKNLSLGLNYGMGITNIFPSSDPGAKHRIIGLQVGVHL